jgi:hypothetical protein
MIDNKVLYNLYLNNQTTEGFLLNKYSFHISTCDQYFNKKESYIISESSISKEKEIDDSIEHLIGRSRTTFGSKNLIPE